MRPSSTASRTAHPGSFVPAVAKPAVTEKRPQLDERMRDRVRRDVRESERLQSRRIDDPAVAAPRRAGDAASNCDVVWRPVRERLRNLRRLRAGVGRDRVEDRRLAHARLADQHACAARRATAASGARRASPRARRSDSRAPRTARAARGARRNRAGRTCSPTSTNRQPCASAAIDPAMDELLVERQAGRDDAADLRDVGGDQLFAERVGAVEERRARRDRLDRAAARGAARRCTRSPQASVVRAALQHAVDDLAVVERDGEVAPTAGDDQPFAQRRRATGAAAVTAAIVDLRRADDVVQRDAAGAVRRPRDDAWS